MAARALTALSPEGSLSRYLTEIRKFPMLEQGEEYMLAKRFAEHGDAGAAEPGSRVSAKCLELGLDLMQRHLCELQRPEGVGKREVSFHTGDRAHQSGMEQGEHDCHGATR